MCDDRTAIRVSAVVLRAPSGEVLTVRKAGTSRFMLPGGKPMPAESAAETAVRECAEEVSVRLDLPRLREVGVFRAAAANEAGRFIDAAVFEHPLEAVPIPAGEIEELRWLDIDERLSDDVAPLLTDCVVPLLRQEARARSHHRADSQIKKG